MSESAAHERNSSHSRVVFDSVMRTGRLLLRLLLDLESKPCLEEQYAGRHSQLGHVRFGLFSRFSGLQWSVGDMFYLRSSIHSCPRLRADLFRVAMCAERWNN
jgi:hypothetical protein